MFFMDEPDAAVDPDIAEQMLCRVFAFLKERKVTIFLISHLCERCRLRHLCRWDNYFHVERTGSQSVVRRIDLEHEQTCSDTD
jgi:ABC-type thiamine transport system ATPase subunit